jgi:superfamily II RNA helicase
MSVGINLPVKTTIFTDVFKFSGSGLGGAGRRQLHSFEMTQAAGRAGRLGIDTVGNVIHLNNLFPEVDAASYKKMLQGTPQKLESKFRLGYSMVLQQLLTKEKEEKEEGERDQTINLNAYASKSMAVADFQSELEACRTTLAKKQQEKAEQTKTVTQSIEIDALNRYHHCFTTLPKSVNKQRKELTKEMDALCTKHGEAVLKNGLHALKQHQKLDDEIEDALNEIKHMENYMRLEIDKVLGLLKDCQFIGTKSSLAIKATIAQKIHEVPCLPWAELIAEGSSDERIKRNLGSTVKFTELNATELVTMLSCFTSVRVSDKEASKQTHLPDEAIIGRNVRAVMKCMQTMYTEFDEQEAICYVDSGEEYTMHFDLMGLMEEWCASETVEQSKAVLQQVEQQGIFLGEFVKALLKINSVAAELETVAEYLGNLEWLSTLREIPKLTLKFVVTNQSLYV